MTWFLWLAGGFSILYLGYRIVKSESDRIRDRNWLNGQLLRESKQGIDGVCWNWSAVRRRHLDRFHGLHRRRA